MGAIKSYPVTIDTFAEFFTTHPILSEETVIELIRRGQLEFERYHWRFCDPMNGCTRRIDGNNWKRTDHSGAAWHHLIGLEDVIRHDRKYVFFVVEGTKDALAAAEYAFRFGKLDQTGIVCALGSGYRPITSEIEQLKGRYVRVFSDADTSGCDTANILSRALTQAGVEYEIWDWSDAVTTEFCQALKVKDVYDLLAQLDALHGGRVFPAGADGKLRVFPAYAPHACAEGDIHTDKKHFSPSFLPSGSSSVQEFTCSCPETQQAGISAEETLGIIQPFIVTERGTGNRNSFLLARAIKPRKLGIVEINNVFSAWFNKSRHMLPADADEAKSLQTFYRQLKRVRFTESALEAACVRADTAEPPFIPARDGDTEIARLAALCRELQRDAGERAFICPVSVVVDFVPVPWRSQAAWLLHVLEEEGVIKCVDRGSPHRPGQKGKPTCYRYLLPF